MADFPTQLAEAPVDGDAKAVSMMDLVDKQIPDDGDDGASSKPAAKAIVTPDPLPDDKPDEKPAESGVPSDLLDEEKPAEKKSDDKAAEDAPIEDPAGMSRGQAAAFKAMRERADGYAKRLKALESKPPESSDVATKAKLAEYEQRMAQTDFKTSPEFVANHVKPYQAAVKGVLDVAKEYGIKENVIKQAMTLNRADRIRLLKQHDVDDIAIAEITPQISKLNEMKQNASLAIKNHKPAQLAPRRDVAVVGGKVLDDTINSLRDTEGHVLLRDSAKDPTWLKGIKDRARAIVAGSVSDQDFAKAAVKSQLADHYKALYLDAMGKLNKANGRIDSTKRAAGNVGDRAATSAPKQAKAPTSIDDLADATVAFLR